MSLEQVEDNIWQTTDLPLHFKGQAILWDPVAQLFRHSYDEIPIQYIIYKHTYIYMTVSIHVMVSDV